MSIKEFFSNDCATNDYASNEKLLTRYYRNDYNTTKAGLIDAARTMGFNTQNVNDQFKEILFTSKNADMIVSIMTVNYYQMAVDLKITTHYFIAAGRAVKLADEYYNICNRYLNCVQKGGKN